MGPHSFDINGELYFKLMYERLNRELTEVDTSCLDNLEQAIWEKVEEDMGGYICILSGLLRDRIWYEMEQAKKEIDQITK